MWNINISAGCVAMYAAWLAAFVGIVGGWAGGVEYLGQLGLACSALAAALMVMRDNERTRRAVHRATRPGGDVTTLH